MFQLGPIYLEFASLHFALDSKIFVPQEMKDRNLEMKF